MREIFFMQLILVLAVLMLLGGKSGGAPRRELFNPETLELLKYVSGDDGEIDKIINEAEHVAEIISAIVPVAAAFGESDGDKKEESVATTPQDTGIRLKPIANIADDSIYNALSRAI